MEEDQTRGNQQQEPGSGMAWAVHPKKHWETFGKWFSSPQWPWALVSEGKSCCGLVLCSLVPYKTPANPTARQGATSWSPLLAQLGNDPRVVALSFSSNISSSDCTWVLHQNIWQARCLPSLCNAQQSCSSFNAINKASVSRVCFKVSYIRNNKDLSF